MERSKLDVVISFQTQALEGYRRERNLTAKEIASLIEKYHLSKFIQDNYELLHLTGLLGIIEEIDSYIAECERGI